MDNDNEKKNEDFFIDFSETPAPGKSTNEDVLFAFSQDGVNTGTSYVNTAVPPQQRPPAQTNIQGQRPVQQSQPQSQRTAQSQAKTNPAQGVEAFGQTIRSAPPPSRAGNPPQNRGYQEQQPTPPKRKKKKKGKKVLAVLLVLILLFAAAFYYMFGELNITSISSDLSELGINPATAERYKNAGVTNIALFGIDKREGESSYGRSDAVMILSVDRKHNLLKLTSIFRDSRVEIEGHGAEKITHAYFYGGPLLAIKTINQNFDLDIKNYVTVDFYQLTSVIDSIGGIDVEITEQERTEINKYANSEGMSAPEVTSTGLVRLDGTQATAFSRLRFDGDVARANRQRIVLQGMLTTAKSSPVWRYPDMCRTILPLTETSMDYFSIAQLAPTAILGNPDLVQYALPSEADGAYGGEVGGVWVWQFDIPAATERLHQFIYEKSTP